MFIRNKDKYEQKKTLFLIRGLAGSGKTTLAKALATMSQARHGKVWTVCADDYFYDDEGEYNFNASELKNAHEACQARTRLLMKSGVENIVVHNTFSTFWEMQFYHDQASIYDYSVFIIECQNQFGSEHNVPAETIERMKKRFERA